MSIGVSQQFLRKVHLDPIIRYMRPSDFWIERTSNPGWGLTSTEELNEALLRQLLVSPNSEHADVEVAVALARLIHDEFEKFGTDGSERFTNNQSRESMRTLKAILKRLNFEGFSPEYSDFGSFRTYWKRNDGHGSWQARRDMLHDTFNELHEKLLDLETDSLVSSLSTPITSHHRTGWPKVDAEISELRRHFQNARTEQDYRNLGNDCVIILEALGGVVYDEKIHLYPEEEVPSLSSTKQRLDRYIDVAVPGAGNSELRKLAKACIELAQAVKHRTASSRRDAGIAADSVILLANLLRRISES